MEIINKITPNKKERDEVTKVINDFFKQIKPKLKDAIPEVGGSMAKDTWLKGDHDIDIFVKFPHSKYHDKDISKTLQERLKKIRCNVLHGSRDYLQVKKRKYLFELIPVININHSSKHLNITDISPLHARYVKKFNKDPKEIRLAKAFLKANNLYGAESYIRGFSGYVTELLVIYYGDFLSLIKNAALWKQRTIVNMNDFYKSDNEALKNINKDKLSNLILIDPVQYERNAAAALSSEKYFEFINLCKSYLKNPDEKFFELKEFNLEAIKKKAKTNKLITFIVAPLNGKPDVVGSKILKTFNYINNKITKNGFKVLEYKWEWKEDALLYYIVKNEKLTEYVIHHGPFKKDLDNVKKFKAKWKKISFDRERTYVKLKRKYDTIDKLVKIFLKDKYIKDNVKSIKLKIY